jgi:hypothetical protein
MLQKIKHIALNFFLILMALQILNLSIDAVDFNPLRAYTTESFNYYNSAVEFVSETIMQKDVFPEIKNTSSKTTQSAKHLSFKIFQPNVFLEPTSKEELKAKRFTIIFKENYQCQFFKEINPPPPKA